jgi:hypothetical protein
VGVDVLIVGLGSTAGLRASDTELRGALERAGARVELAQAAAPREVRTLMLTDLLWARAARAAARAAIAEHEPRAIVYSTITAALLWPRAGAIRYDALGSENRRGRHGLWQRPLERRRLAAAPALISMVGVSDGRQIVVPIPVAPSGPLDGPRDIAALAYGANAEKKGLDRVFAAWALARRDGEELVVAGARDLPEAAGVRDAGMLAPDDYRALLRRARVYVTAPRREDYGIAQLEALADGAQLVTTTAPGPYAALPLARALDSRLVVENADDAHALAAAVRAALDSPAPDYRIRAAAALQPYTREAVDRTVAAELLPRLLGSALQS